MPNHALKPIVIFWSTIFLAGCQPAVVPDPAMGAGRCPADQSQSLVGAQLAAVTLPAGLNMRIINPGDAVTQDFQPGRMNIMLDRNGVITRIDCG